MTQKKDKSILVFRFSSLGDIAMTIPVLRSFFNTYPDQQIIFYIAVQCHFKGHFVPRIFFNAIHFYLNTVYAI